MLLVWAKREQSRIEVSTVLLVQNNSYEACTLYIKIIKWMKSNLPDNPQVYVPKNLRLFMRLCMYITQDYTLQYSTAQTTSCVNNSEQQFFQGWCYHRPCLGNINLHHSHSSGVLTSELSIDICYIFPRPLIVFVFLTFQDHHLSLKGVISRTQSMTFIQNPWNCAYLIALCSLKGPWLSIFLCIPGDMP